MDFKIDITNTGEVDLDAVRLVDLLRSQGYEVIAPFSPHYRQLFAAQKIDVNKIKTVADLQHLPFTNKADLFPTPEQPEKFRDFIITPDITVLKHRPRVVAEASSAGSPRDTVRSV